MRYDLVDLEYPMEPDPAFRRRAAWLLARLESAFPEGGAKVLDIGCGQGFYLPLCLRLGLNWTGVDIDGRPLSSVPSQVSRAGTATAGWIRARAEVLPFPAHSFDAVILSEVLEHLPDPGLALAEAARVLKPEGLALITVPNADYPLAWDPLNGIREALGLQPVRTGVFAGIWAHHERLYTVEQLETEVRRACFIPEPALRMTRWCLPFIHNLVYGLGRKLLEGGRLPRAWTGYGLRGAEQVSGSRRSIMRLFNPVAGAIALIRLTDRLNGDLVPRGSSQNICLAAWRISSAPRADPPERDRA